MAGADALQRISMSSAQHHEEEASELEKVGSLRLMAAQQKDRPRGAFRMGRMGCACLTWLSPSLPHTLPSSRPPWSASTPSGWQPRRLCWSRTTTDAGRCAALRCR